MNTTIRGLLAAACLFGAQQLSADIYLRGGLMYNQPQDLSGSDGFKAALDNSTAFSLALGYKLSIFRVEAEGMMLRSSVDDVSGADSTWGKGKLKSSSIFVNGYLDVPGIPIITPYVGVGAGIGWVDFDGDFDFVSADDVKFKERSTLPGYQAMLGVKAKVPFTGVSAYAQYRYLHMNRLRASSSDSSAPVIETGDSNMWEIGISITL